MKNNAESIRLCGHIRLQPQEWQRHWLLLGEPGSGKTVLLTHLLEQIIKAYGNSVNRPGFIVLEAKPGDLGARLHEALRRNGRETDYVELRPGRSAYNPLANPFLASDMTAAERLLEAARQATGKSSSGIRKNEEFWHHGRLGMVATILSLARAQALDQPLTLRGLEKVKNEVLAMRSSEDWQAAHPKSRVPAATLGYLRRHLALPDGTRSCIDSAVEASLKTFFSPESLALSTPQPGRRLIDPTEVVQDGQCLVLSTTSPSAFGESLQPLNTLCLDFIVRLILARSILRIVDDTGGIQPLNQARRVIFVIDECHNYITNPLLQLISEGRQNGAVAVLATQSLSTLSHVSVAPDRLTSCCANAIMMATTDIPTADRANALFTAPPSANAAASPWVPPPLLFPSLRVEADPGGQVGRVTLAELSRLKTGAFFLRTAQGRTYRSALVLSRRPEPSAAA